VSRTPYPLAFFSLIKLTDERDRAAYNRWHLFDHRPENLALPGVAWGERWERRADSPIAHAGVEQFADLDYLAMYFFREPPAASIADWDRLGADSFQWGRGPLFPGVERRLLAFFRPVKGYASRAALVGPEVVPMRPNRGVQVTMTRYGEPFGAAAHADFAWEDQVLVPELLQVPGVAGAWTFSFLHYQQHSTLPLTGDGGASAGSIRLRLVYLDDDPAATTRGIEEATAEAQRLGGGHDSGAEPLLSTTLHAIWPWEEH